MDDLSEFQLLAIGLGAAFIWSLVWFCSILSYDSLLYRIENAGRSRKEGWWIFTHDATIYPPSDLECRDALIWGACFLAGGLILGLVAPMYLTLAPIELFLLRLVAIILVFQMGLVRILMLRTGSLAIGLGYLFSAVIVHILILKPNSSNLNINYSHILVLGYLTLAAFGLCRAIFMGARSDSYLRGSSQSLIEIALKALGILVTFVEFFNTIHGLLK